MRILMLNWRDPWHPKRGGAETVTLRVLERLVSAYGCEVEWFSGAYDGAIEKQSRHGICFVRRGTQLTVHAQAFLRYRRKAYFDVVIDQMNTVPFFTPVYISVPTVLFVHQLAREVWFYEAPPIASHLGYVAEPLFLKPYRNAPVITVSKSTESSIRALGLKGKMTIISEAVDEEGSEIAPAKNAAQDIIVLGRVTPSKRIEHSIVAASHLQRMGWNGALHVVGAGNPKYIASLQQLAARVGFRSLVTHGRVSDDERKRLLRAATVLWMTSVREGWGLVVTEAAKHWTPSVVYNSPGLCDSVLHDETGFVVAPTPKALAMETFLLFRDAERIWRYAKNGRAFAQTLHWDRTAAEFYTAIKDVVRRNGK